jgi:hypothetical protein
MAQWWSMSQKAAKQHDYYKTNISMSQESQPIPGLSSRDTAHKNAIDVRKWGTRRTHACNHRSVLSVLKWDTITVNVKQ